MTASACEWARIPRSWAVAIHASNTHRHKDTNKRSMRCGCAYWARDWLNGGCGGDPTIQRQRYTFYFIFYVYYSLNFVVFSRIIMNWISNKSTSKLIFEQISGANSLLIYYSIHWIRTNEHWTHTSDWNSNRKLGRTGGQKTWIRLRQ